MEREELLKELIINKCGSILNFSKETGIPNTTIRNIFNRGLGGVGVGTVIEICKYLEIDLESLMDGTLSIRPNEQKENVFNQYRTYPCSSAGQRIGYLYDKAEDRDKKIVETVLEPYDTGEEIPPAPVVVELPKAKRRRDGFIEVQVYDQPAAAGLGNYLDEPTFTYEQYPADLVPRGADFGIRISGDSMEPRIRDGSAVFVRACPSVEPGQIGIFILDGNAYCKQLMVDKDARQIRLVSLNKRYNDIIVSDFSDFRTVGQVLS